MGHEIEDEVIRRYLLGQLAEDERQQLEEKIMVDNELFNRVLLAEDEMVEEYVQGELPERERESFEASFLSTPQGREQVSFAKALSKYVSITSAEEGRAVEEPARVSNVHRPVWWRPPALIPYFTLAATAVIMLAVGLGTWRTYLYFRQSQVSKGIAALAEAYREQRPLEARITGLNYAPVANTRGEQAKADQVALDRAERILLDAVFEHPGPASHHALGRLYLAEQEFDKAIAQFEEALKTDPNNAQLHSDLGAALLENGKALERKEPGSGAQPFAESLTHLSRAIELNDSLLEAHFNLALLYEQMKLSPEAKEEWRRYLLRDSTSEWGKEASRNLNRLEQQGTSPRTVQDSYRDFVLAFESRDDETAWTVLRRSRAGGGNLVVDQLLSEYLDLRTRGDDAAADTRIRELSYAGALEAARAGDRYTTSLTKVYSGRSAATLSALILARTLMTRGHRSYEQSKLEDAIEHYIGARNAFGKIGDNSEARYIDYRIGHCYLGLSKSKESLEVFERLATDCEQSGYRWLLAQARYSIANVHIGMNNYSRALDVSNEFLDLSRELSDPIGVVNAIQQIGQEYLFLNNYAKSLSFQWRSLSEVADSDIDPLQRWRAYFYVSLPLNRLGLHAAAVKYQKEALRLALELGRPLPICRSYINLGLMYGARGDYDEALKNVRQAFELAETLASPRQRKESLAYASLQAGHLYWKAGDLSSAMTNYGRAFELYTDLDSDAFKYSSLKGKLLACIALGGCPSVDQDIEKGMSLFEEYRAKIVEESNRDSFFDLEQDLYDAAIDYKYSKANYETAFEYAERSRARSLFDIATDRVASSADAEIRFRPPYEPLRVSDLLARLPNGAQILQYAVLNDKVIIFAVSRSAIVPFQYPISSTELAEVVDRLLRSITASPADDEEANRTGRLLYRILIAPVESWLDKSKLLCVTPDKVLYHLPFGALISPSGTYLVEDYALIYSPSTNMFVVSTESASARQNPHEERALAVGDPAFDLSTFAPLAYLPDARTEATQVAGCYRNSVCLLAEGATKRRVLSATAKADVVEIAAHAVVDDRSPLQSKLLLANEAGQSGDSAALRAFEIYNLKFPNTRLVVLAACKTAAGRYYGGEGVISLSRSFLAARIPLVVASLWAVDSDATAKLMINFHKLRKGGSSTVDALRGAQRNMLQGHDEQWRRPYYWASFIALGGFATF
jgi:CHAT domain-containing protein/Tfp pilus assembly protein PilF